MKEEITNRAYQKLCRIFLTYVRSVRACIREVADCYGISPDVLCATWMMWRKEPRIHVHGSIVSLETLCHRAFLKLEKRIVTLYEEYRGTLGRVFYGLVSLCFEHTQDALSIPLSFL